MMAESLAFKHRTERIGLRDICLPGAQSSMRRVDPVCGCIYHCLMLVVARAMGRMHLGPASGPPCPTSARAVTSDLPRVVQGSLFLFRNRQGLPHLSLPPTAADFDDRSTGATFGTTDRLLPSSSPAPPLQLLGRLLLLLGRLSIHQQDPLMIDTTRLMTKECCTA